MAEIRRPDYSKTSTRSQVYNVAPVQQTLSQGDENVGRVDMSNSKIFDALLNGVGVFAEIYQKSEQTATRLKAKELIINKMKHHENQKLLLKEHLPFTDPAEIGLQTSLSKFRQEDEQGRTMYNIGKDLSVNISPQKIPDNVSDSVLELIEESFVRMDSDLLSSIISEVEQAQTKQDLNFLTQEKDIYGQGVISVFRNSDSTKNAIEQSKTHLANIWNAIDERSLQGGTLDVAEVNTEKYQTVQTMLQAWYQREMRDPNIRRDEVINDAEKGKYQIKIEGKTYKLSPSFYNADFLKRNERNENIILADAKTAEQTKVETFFADYQRNNSGDNFKKGYNISINELKAGGVTEYDAIRWITEQETKERVGGITDLESTMWSESEFNKGFLSKFTKQGTTKDRFGSTKLLPLEKKALADKIRDEFPDAKGHEYITQSFITRLITAHEAGERKESIQKELKEKSGTQNSVIAGLKNMAIQPTGAAKVLDRFYYKNTKDEWELDYSKIKSDQGLSVFGENSLDERVNAIDELGRMAMKTHEDYMKSLQPKDIPDSRQPAILDSIAREYQMNISSALKKAKLDRKEHADIMDENREASDQLDDDTPFGWGNHRHPDSGKSNNIDHIVEQFVLEEDLQGLTKIGQTIMNMDTRGLKDSISYINGEHPEHSRNKYVRDYVLQEINKRQVLLQDHAAMTAIVESGQRLIFEAGKPINVDFIHQWQKEYNAGNKNQLIPKAILAKIGELGDQSIDKQTRMAQYIQLLGRVSQFGKADTQRIAYQEVRLHIKKNVSPSMAALSDVWDNVDLGIQEQLFGIATSKLVVEGTGGIPDTESYKEVKEHIDERARTEGMNTTMQSTEQKAEHLRLQRDIVEALSLENYWKGRDAKEIATDVDEMLYGGSSVIKTGQRYNFSADDSYYERLGMESTEAKNGYKFYMYNMEHEENPASWTTISGIDPQILSQMRDQALQSSMMTNITQGVKRFREMKDGEYTGKIIEENIKTGVQKEVFSDAFSRIQAQSAEQISEDILRANSKNLRKGFINATGGGYNIGVYLVGPNGSIDQSMLIGHFFQKDKKGKKTPKVVTQEELARLSASPYLLNYLNGAKFILNFDHQYVKDLKADGAKRILDNTMAPAVTEMPFLRFLEKAGVSEFEGAILPLYNEMEKKAKELGVDTLNREQSEKILDNLIQRQNRWYKKSWMPHFMNNFLESFTSGIQQTSLRDLKELREK